MVHVRSCCRIRHSCQPSVALHVSFCCYFVFLLCCILKPIRFCDTELDLHHDSENQARWLLTGSLDRRVKLFDLENATPTEVSTSHLRSRIRSGYWPLHWNIHFSVVDDTVALKCGGLIQKQPLNLCQGLAAALMADGDPSSLAFNDWLNTSVFGTSHGDIFVNYFTQLLRGISSKSDDPKAVCVASIITKFCLIYLFNALKSLFCCTGYWFYGCAPNSEQRYGGEKASQGIWPGILRLSSGRFHITYHIFAPYNPKKMNSS